MGQKKIELTLLFGSRLVALYLPDFDSVESGLFTKKSEHLPNLPKNIEELKGLPDG